MTSITVMTGNIRFKVPGRRFSTDELTVNDSFSPGDSLLQPAQEAFPGLRFSRPLRLLRDDLYRF
jgi:hypothetical protein